MDSKTVLGLLGLAGVVALAYNYSKDTEENYNNDKLNYVTGIDLTAPEYRFGLRNGFSPAGSFSSDATWIKSQENMSTKPINIEQFDKPNNYIMARNTASPNIREVTVTGLSDSVRNGTADVGNVYDPRDTASSLGCGFSKENYTHVANSVSNKKLVPQKEQQKQMLNTNVDDFGVGDMTTEFNLNGQVQNVVANPLMYSLVSSMPRRNWTNQPNYLVGDLAIAPITLNETLFGANTGYITDLYSGAVGAMFGDGSSAAKTAQCLVANSGITSVGGVSLTEQAQMYSQEQKSLSMANDIRSSSNLNSQSTRMYVGSHDNKDRNVQMTDVYNMINNRQ